MKTVAVNAGKLIGIPDANFIMAQENISSKMPETCIASDSKIQKPVDNRSGSRHVFTIVLAMYENEKPLSLLLPIVSLFHNPYSIVSKRSTRRKNALRANALAKFATFLA